MMCIRPDERMRKVATLERHRLKSSVGRIAVFPTAAL